MEKITYENQDNSSFLVYQLEPPEQLDQLAIEMLSNNRVEGVISPVLLQKDKDIFLRYNITSKVTLTSFYRDTLNRQRFLGPLFSIATAMKTAESYMLDASAFLLDAEYIFVDVSLGKANMVYLPLEQTDRRLGLANFIKGLLMNVRFDPSENTVYVTQILNFCNSDEFSLAGLHSLLKELVAGEAAYQTPVPYAPPPAYSAPMAGPVSLGEFAATQQPVPPQQPLPALYPPEAPLPPQAPAAGNKRKGLFGSKKGAAAPKQANPKKEKPVKQKAPKKSKKPPAPVAVNFAIPGQTPPSVTPEAAPMPGGEPFSFPAPAASNAPAPAPTPEYSPAPAANYSPASPTEHPFTAPAKYSPAPAVNSPSLQPPVAVGPPPAGAFPPVPVVVPPVRAVQPAPTPDSFGNTMVLGQTPSDATTVLSDDAGAKSTKFILVREKTGERIDISKSPYRIGKERRYVDYCITDNSTISRSHADLLVENDMCYLVDNNSTNHTYVGGQMVTSNTKIPLQNDTQVVFSNEYFVFQIR